MTQESRQSILDVIRTGSVRLAESGSASPRLDAELLLGHLLSYDRTRLLARGTDAISGDIRDQFESLVDRRCSGVPVAYLTGSREFMGLSFATGPGVLTPRPETEMLLEWALGWLASHPLEPNEIVADVGTGTGAIALSLATLSGRSGPRIVACDSSRDAIRWATRNRINLGFSAGVHLVQGDLLSWLGRPARLVLANLPYLRPDQVAGNWELSAEPVEALVSGTDGLWGINRLIDDCPRVLAPNGAIGLEIDPSQSTAVLSRLQLRRPDLRSRVLADLSGRDRFVIGESVDAWPNSSVL